MIWKKSKKSEEWLLIDLVIIYEHNFQPITNDGQNGPTPPIASLRRLPFSRADQ